MWLQCPKLIRHNVNNNPLFKAEESIYDNTSNLIIQGDAGPDQLAIGFYCNKTKELISWTKYKLPYPKWDNVNSHTYYEYLVFMLSQILIYINTIFKNLNLQNDFFLVIVVFI